MKKYVDISCDKDTGISVTTIDPDTPYWVMKDLLKIPSQVLGAVTGVTLKIYQEDNTEDRCVFYWEDNENPGLPRFFIDGNIYYTRTSFFNALLTTHFELEKLADYFLSQVEF